MSFTKITIAAAALIAAAGTAGATTITVDPSQVGSSFTVNYDGFSDGNTIAGLTGSTTFRLTGVTDTSYTFDYSVANTSSDPIDASRISIFGFNTNPDIDSASSTGMFDMASSGNVPSGFGQVEVCFKGAGGNNCSGGGGEGVMIGDSTAGSLTLNFADAIDQLTLSDFFVRYQAIEGAGNVTSAIGRGMEGGSSGGSTGGSTGGSSGGTPVPAPAGVLLLAAGFAGIGIRFGRSNRSRI